MMSKRRRRPYTAFIVAVLALIAGASVLTSSRAEAQIRPRCGSPAQAFASAVGDRLGSIFGRAGRGAEVVGGVGGTVGFENVNDVWSRCAEPYLNPDPPPRDPPSDEITRAPGPLPEEFRFNPSGFGSAAGDPHIRTLDGVGYSFQAGGDYVLVSDPVVGVEIHARFGRSFAESAITTVRGVAMRVGDEVITLNDVPEAGFFFGEDVRVNGEPMAFLPGGWYEGDAMSVLRVDDTILITTDAGYAINYTGTSLLVDAPTARAGQPVGLLGNNDDDLDNDLRLADGSSFGKYDTDVIYGQFLDDWRVDRADTLFETPFDLNAQGPIRPLEIVTLDTLPADAVAEASRACTAAGLVAGFGLEECVYDVAVTGDEGWIEPDLGFVHGQGTVAAAALDPELVSSRTVVIEPETPVAVAGELVGIGTAHEFVLGGDGTDVRVVRVGEPCADVLAPTVTVILDDRPLRSRPLVCGATIAIPAGDVRLHVVQRFETSPSYAFSVGHVGTTDLGTLSEADLAGAELLTQERAVARLEFDAGQTIFLDTEADSCSVRGSVVDASGELLAERTLCLTIGVVTLTGQAPFTFVVTNRSPATSSFTVTTTAVAATEAAVAGLDREIVLDVTTAGQQPSAELELTAGQRVFIQNLAEDPLGEVALIDPAGEVVAARLSSLDVGLVEITASGTHVVRFEPRASATGRHRLIVHEIPADATTQAQFGSEAVAVVSVPGQRAVLTVDATAGERLFIDAVEDAGIADVALVGPSNEVLVEALSFEETGPVDITATGVHQLVITPRTTIVGDYRFVIHRVPENPMASAALGDEVTIETTTPGQNAIVTFEAQEGEQLIIESLANSGLGDVVVLAPSGAVVVEFLSFETSDPITVPESGTYRVELDHRGDGFGPQTWLVRAAG